MLATGDILNNRYRIEAHLATGGFAAIYRATDLVLGRAIAVKVLHPHVAAAQPDFAARFAAEARLLAALAHPNILAVHDFGQHNGVAFLVMPLVTGGSLADLLRRRQPGPSGRLPPTRALRYLRQAAAALDHAHACGLVHRDVKPDNMLLDATGEHLQLADFGIARALTGTSAQASLVVGTVAYMAPEQIRGNVSQAIDIYALGCVAFQLLTGRLPYDGTIEQVIHGHLGEPIPTLDAHLPLQLAASVQLVFNRALAKERTTRYPTAHEFADALASVLIPASSPTSTLPATPPGLTLSSSRALSTDVLTGHKGAVRRVSWSPNSRILASCSEDGTVRIWSGDGTCIRTLTDHVGSVQLLAWSPNGRILASADRNHALRLWSPDGSLLSVLTGHTNLVLEAAWSPDGRILATASDDNHARLWSADGTPIKAIGHGSEVTALAWSPDGRTLATSPNDRTVRLWSAGGDPKKTLTGHTSAVTFLTWSPNSRTLASASWDTTVRLWSANGSFGRIRLRDTPAKVLTGHTLFVTALAWSPDGRALASASRDDTVRLWSPEGILGQTLTDHTGKVEALAWSPDGRILASGGTDSKVRLWSADGALKATLTGHTGVVTALAWSPDGSILASASLDNTVRLWR